MIDIQNIFKPFVKVGTDYRKMTFQKTIKSLVDLATDLLNVMMKSVLREIMGFKRITNLENQLGCVQDSE